MFKEKIAEAIAKKVDVKKEDILKEIESNTKFGDFSLPCFFLASKLKKNPAQIADELSKIKFPKEIEKAESQGPYINFFIDKKLFNESIIKEILSEKENYGRCIKKGRKIMVEYSSPNTNKPLHLGHLKNNSIGMSLSNILEFSGAKVIKTNLLNDRGIHICKVMYAYKKFSKKKKPDKKQDHFVGDLYVLYSKNSDEKTEREVLEMLNKLEKKDKNVLRLWKEINKWAEKGIFETYKKFGTKFDVIFKESQFFNKAKEIIRDGLKKKVFSKESDGGVIANLDPLPNKVILRKDGTSLYVTNDLALTKHKFDNYNLNEAIWVTGSEQKLYFEQLFRIFFLLGFDFSDRCVHVPYGMVLLESGKMKSREGKVVDADGLIEEVNELAKKEILKREKLSENELVKRAKAIALSAIKFYLIKVDIAKDVLFDPEKAVSFDGYTGPYLQYAYARASNILKKIKDKKEKTDYFLLKENEEAELIRKLAEFRGVIKIASEKLRPDFVANYSYQLCQKFANFYDKCSVINAGEEKQARIGLVKAFRHVLGNCLKLLDIELLERM